jgi:hypothetical protein
MCAHKGQNCSLLTSLSLNRQKFIAPAVTETATWKEVNDEVRDELVDVYLQLIHDKPHTLFHPTTLRARVQTGSLPEAVLYSILAFAVRLAGDHTIQERAKDFSHIAKEALKRTIDKVTLDNVHASALVGNLCGIEGDSSGESLFFGQ